MRAASRWCRASSGRRRNRTRCGRKLPHDYRALLPPSLCHDAKCKKQLYLTLCDRPVLIDQGRKSFSLEKWSGKKCYMLSVRDLAIIWGNTPRNWRWFSLPDSRFSDVAELIDVCWLEIRGRISIGLLSSMTHYRAYLVFNTTSAAYGLDYHPVEAVVALAGTEGKKQTVYLGTAGERRQQRQMVPRRVTRLAPLGKLEMPPQPGRSGMRHPKERTDGWLEIELGEFFNEGSKDGELEMSVLEVRGGNWKSGHIVQGIVIRQRGYVTRVGSVNNG